jgi:hypothetical protein
MPSSRGDTHTHRISVDAKRGNPVVVRHKSVSQRIFGTKAQPHSGHRKTREAKAASRKARGIHNPADTGHMARTERSLTRVW